MIQRIILLVLNGLGVGVLPDAASSEQGSSDSLTQVLASTADLRLPTLEALGLGHIVRQSPLRRMDQPEACFGRVARRSPASDAMAACWELSGLPIIEPLPSFRQNLPPEMVHAVEQAAQRQVLQLKGDVLEEILSIHGPHSYREKAVLLWGEPEAACLLAAHESVVSPKDLFRLAREVRTVATAFGVRRVGARPFGGGAGAWTWIEGWRESCLRVPAKSMFDYLNGAVQLVTSFGKTGDFFNGSGFTRSIPVESTAGAWADLLKTLKTTPRGLILVNLFDDLQRMPRKQYGPMLADQLQEFDSRLPEVQTMLKSGDLVCITSDQARDPRHPERSLREYAPLLVFGPKLARGVNLGDRPTYADLGQTIVEAFKAPPLSVGESFLHALRPG